MSFLSLMTWIKSMCNQKHADLVLLDGKIWTVDPQNPWAEAIAIQNDTIVAVGSSEEVKQIIGSDTHVLELYGDLALPGFIDSHTHFLEGGVALSGLQLRDAASQEEFIARIRDEVADTAEGEWILNGDWDEQHFRIPKLPVKEWIDGVTPVNPVCLGRLDKHMVFVNSLALSLAGITRDTNDPPGGMIARDPQTGEPTGILKDEAMNLVMRHIPEPSISKKEKAAEAAMAHARKLGVTSVHDMSSLENFDVYHRLFQQQKLTTRICVYIPISNLEHYLYIKAELPPENSFLKLGGLKGFVDGSLGSSTALFFNPYTDNPETMGIIAADMVSEGIMEKRIQAADEMGLQTAVHAIGDKANHIILDIYERTMVGKEPRDRRWRIEHGQHLVTDDMERLSRLGILASVQPYHAIDDGRWAEGKIGRERLPTSYAFRSLLDKGAVLACGSDWTVAPLDPLSGIYAAVTRRTVDGHHPQGWYPEQKISLEEVIQGYTINGAYAEFAEGIKGSLEVGKLADIVVLDRDLFKIPPEKIWDTEVRMTICHGQVVYER